MDQFSRKNPPTYELANNQQTLLEAETLLLIVDVQQKLISNIIDNQLLIFNIKKLIDTCNLLMFASLFQSRIH